MRDILRDLPSWAQYDIEHPEPVPSHIGGLEAHDGGVIIYNDKNIKERIWFRYDDPNTASPPTTPVR